MRADCPEDGGGANARVVEQPRITEGEVNNLFMGVVILPARWTFGPGAMRAD